LLAQLTFELSEPNNVAMYSLELTVPLGARIIAAFLGFVGILAQKVALATAQPLLSSSPR
jgi:hypothetical protein